MRLYDCSTAPSPRRVRMFIAEKGISVDTVQVDLASGEQHGDAFAAINPHRTVPVLQLDDGSCLTTTGGICHYLERQFPQPPLIGRDAAEHGLIVDLVSHIEQDGYLAIAEAFRNKARSFSRNALTGAQQYEQIPELVERGRSRTGHFFVWLDQTLQNKTYLAGDAFSMADISAFIAVEFSAWIKVPVPDSCSALLEWRDRISERPSAGA